MDILIIDLVHQILTEKLTAKGYNCTYLPNISEKEILEILPNYQGLIIRSKIKISKEILEQNKQLKFIARVGAGLESIDVIHAEKLGIKCINSPEGNRNAVGEQAVGMLLNLFNKICKANNEVKNGIWQREPNRGLELSGKTIGIIGYGNTGSAFAKCLKGFDVKVISYDKYKTNYSDGNTTEVSVNEIFKQANILSFHVPLTPETQFMFDSEYINKFAKKFYLLNTARGKVVKTSDLIENIESGKILGAALDVLEYEKVSFEELYHNKNIQFLINSEKTLLTPHIAGLTIESNIKLSEVIAEKIINL